MYRYTFFIAAIPAQTAQVAPPRLASPRLAQTGKPGKPSKPGKPVWDPPGEGVGGGIARLVRAVGMPPMSGFYFPPLSVFMT